jgi:hypothetical protein
MTFYKPFSIVPSSICDWATPIPNLVCGYTAHAEETVESNWQIAVPTWKNQKILTTANADFAWETPTDIEIHGRVHLIIPTTQFEWKSPRIFEGTCTVAEANWTTPIPQWRPSRPLPRFPRQTLVTSYPTPRIYREPNLLGLRYAVPIYSAELTGQPPISLKLISFQATVNNDNYSYLSASVHGITDFEEIAERIGNYLIIKKGYRWPDGTQQLDELIRTKFEKLRYDLGANSGRANVTGYYAAVQSSDRVRKLTGISYLSVSDGKMRVRCEVDTFLRPGGLADANGDIFTVGEITYSVSHKVANMEVSEK